MDLIGVYNREAEAGDGCEDAGGRWEDGFYFIFFKLKQNLYLFRPKGD